MKKRIMSTAETKRTHAVAAPIKRSRRPYLRLVAPQESIGTPDTEAKTVDALDRLPVVEKIERAEKRLPPAPQSTREYKLIDYFFVDPEFPGAMPMNRIVAVSIRKK